MKVRKKGKDRIKRSKAKKPHRQAVPKESVRERGGQLGRIPNLFEALVEVGGATPTSAILDIGCATGRFAERFANFLTEGSSFDGVDVRPKAIRSCQRRFDNAYPHFNFEVADVFNTRYNTGGSAQADAYRLPYDDSRFDFVYGLSLFTHMMPPDVRNYLAETARVLKPSGRCFFTYLLLNAESVAAIEAGYRGADRLVHDHGDYRVRSEEVPESQIAIKEEIVMAAYAEAGLTVVEPVHYGHWPGRSDAISRQDIVVAEKV